MVCYFQVMQPCEPCSLESPQGHPSVGQEKRPNLKLRRLATKPSFLTEAVLEPDPGAAIAALQSKVEDDAGFDGWLLTIVDPASGNLTASVPDRDGRGFRVVRSLLPWQGLHGSVARSGEPLVVQRPADMVAQAGSLIDSLQLSQAADHHSLLIAPVMHGNTLFGTLGVLCIRSEDSETLNEELHYLGIMAAQLGIALWSRRAAVERIENLLRENDRLRKQSAGGNSGSESEMDPLSLAQKQVAAFPRAGMPLEKSLARIEKEMIVAALKQNRGFMAKAARQLGVTERIMALRVRKLGIDPLRYRTWPGVSGKKSAKTARIAVPRGSRSLGVRRLQS